MSQHILEMTEDYCCGGGHCGPLPGYNFHCPACDKDTYCRTGKPLKEGQTFKCLRCKKAMTVLSMDGSSFEVELEV
jgi:hypothetical protein